MGEANGSHSSLHTMETLRLPPLPLVLRTLREARGITQEGFAARLGYSHRTVRRWESGEAIPDARGEEALLSYCRERGLFVRYHLGPLRGFELTPDGLRALLAAARMEHATARAAPTTIPPSPARAPSHAVPAGARDDLDPGPESRPDAGRERPPLPPLLAAADERTPFVGRERDLTHVEGAYARARGGRCQAVLLAGEPGIGKTRLASEFARAAYDAGATVLFGRCDEEITIPYQPFVEALRHYLGSLSPETLDRQLGGRGELARLLPDLASRAGVAGPSADGSPEMQRYHLFEAVGSLLAEASIAAPVVLILEDMHWADKPALLLFKHLVRTATSARLMVLGTYRETDLPRGHPLAEVLADLRREHHITRITLRGLDQPAVTSLVDAWSGQPAPRPLVRAVYTETDGVPFVVAEVLQHLEESGAIDADGRWRTDIPVDTISIPAGVHDVLGRRLSRLSAPCSGTLAVAAVIGREFDVTALGRVADLSDDDLVGAIEEALGARLVVDVPHAIGRYSFAHAFIRRTLYDETSTVRRVRLHRQIGEALEALRRPDDPSTLEALAHHFFEAAPAGDAAKAVRYATEAGDHAVRALAFEEAARQYGRALRVLGSAGLDDGHGAQMAELHAKRGRAYVTVGLWAEAKPDLEAALVHLAAERVEQRVELLVQLVMVGYWLLDPTAALRAADEALVLARQLDRRDLITDVQAWRAVVEGAAAPDIGAVTRPVQQVIEETGALNNMAGALIANLLYLLGQTDEAVRASDLGVAAAEERPDISLMIYTLTSRGLALAGAGRYREAVATFTELRAFGTRYGVRTLLARGISCSGGLYRDLYDYGRAEAIQREARAMALSFDFQPTALQSGIDLVFILARTGRLTEAGRMLAEVEETLEGMKGWHAAIMKSRFMAAAAEVAVTRHDRGRALDAAAAAIAEARAARRPKYEALALRLHAAALLEHGRAHEAIGELRAAIALARQVGDPAMMLHTAADLLVVEPTEEIIRGARAVLDRITAELPDDGVRRQFEAAGAVTLVRRLSD